MQVVLTDSGIQKKVDELIKLVYWGAWGKGAGTAAKTDGNLFQFEAGRAPTTMTRIDPSTIEHDWKLVANEDVTITEAGIFTGQTANTIIFHSTFDGIALLVGDSIVFTLTHEMT